MERKSFTGKELAEAHLLHLTNEELWEYVKKDKTKSRVHSNGFFATLWRRIRPGKLFLIQFAPEDGSHGVTLMAKDEEDACIQAVPFLMERAEHSCRNPNYNESCDGCREKLDKLSERLNNATVTWLGWAQPDWNWVIHS